MNNIFKCPKGCDMLLQTNENLRNRWEDYKKRTQADNLIIACDKCGTGLWCNAHITPKDKVIYEFYSCVNCDYDCCRKCLDRKHE